MKRPQRDPVTKKYHIKGKKYPHLFGTRKQVYFLQTAYKTAGGLTKEQLTMNKSGEIVSKIKQEFEKKAGRLKTAGYTTRKGKFGAIKIKK